VSLKYVHLLFIGAAAAFSLLFGAWAVLAPEVAADVRVMGWISTVLGFGLVCYGVYFLRKSRRIIV
jgi:hypothetical protein